MYLTYVLSEEEEKIPGLIEQFIRKNNTKAIDYSKI